MGSILVVVDTPHANLRTRLVKIGEPVLVQAFIAEAAVEALNERVLDRLAGLDEMQSDLQIVGPGVERPASDLGPVVPAERVLQGAPLTTGRGLVMVGAFRS